MFDKYIGDLTKLQEQLTGFREQLQSGINKSMQDQPDEMKQAISNLISKAQSGAIDLKTAEAEIERLKNMRDGHSN